jgi:pimeloyl-ACP methyl ester carboxylesterase
MSGRSRSGCEEMENLSAEIGTMQALCSIARSLGITYKDDSPPAEGFSNSNGTRLHWVDWGGAERPSVLFLHGAALSARTWDLVCLAMRTDYHCIALDQRGHGRSEGVFSFGVDEPREDIRGVVQALGLERPIFVGMSVGGNNTIAYAGRYADEMAAAVFVDICPTVLPASFQLAVAHDAAIATSSTVEAAAEMAHRINPRGSKAYKRYTLSYSLERFADGCLHLRYERDRPAPTSAEQVAQHMARRREMLWSCVPNIKCPSLVVHGADSVPQTFENLERFRALLPRGSIVQIPNASHDVQEDEPKALTEAISGFLRSIVN